MRKSTVFLVCMGAGTLINLALLIGHPWISGPGYRKNVIEKQRLVKELGLTDLCLFTEARYTRHPAMADRHSAFQDHPLALDHFPSGSIIRIPHQSAFYDLIWDMPGGAR